MQCDVSELIEDAARAYLVKKVRGKMRHYQAWGPQEFQYPCTVVNVAGSEPLSELSAHEDGRMYILEIAVITEAIDELGTTGAVMKTARERNRAARSPVIEAIAVSDLNAQLIKMKIKGLALSMAQLAGMRREVEDNALISILEVEVIAEPVQES